MKAHEFYNAELIGTDEVPQHLVQCKCGKAFVRDRLADAAVALERHTSSRTVAVASARAQAAGD